MGNIASTFRGEENAVNPLPTRDQPIGKFDETNFGRLSAVDINSAYNTAIDNANSKYVL
jgi:hypothetical protein